MDKRLFPDNKLIIIPSWGKLLGYPELGMYKDQKIIKIISDVVIFVSGIEGSIKNKLQSRHYLFGTGYYYLKFQLEDGEYVIDRRYITGIMMSDFVYQYMVNSKDISLEDEEDVILKELVCKIPFNLDTKTDSQLKIIRENLISKILIPLKEVLIDFIKFIQNKNECKFSKTNHCILCADKEHFNEILISFSMSETIQDQYVEDTAVINMISIGIKRILESDFNSSELSLIEKNIESLENNFSAIEFNPMYPFSLIDNGDFILRNIFYSKQVDPKKMALISQMDVGKGVLLTIPKNQGFIPWSQDFPRRTAESWGIITEEINIQPNDDNIQTEQQNHNLKNFDDIDLQTHSQDTGEIIPEKTEKNFKDILGYLNYLNDQYYETSAIGNAFAFACNNIKKTGFHVDFVPEMAKIAKFLQDLPSGSRLEQQDKEKLNIILSTWIKQVEEKDFKNKSKIIPISKPIVNSQENLATDQPSSSQGIQILQNEIIEEKWEQQDEEILDNDKQKIFREMWQKQVEEQLEQERQLIYENKKIDNDMQFHNVINREEGKIYIEDTDNAILQDQIEPQNIPLEVDKSVKSTPKKKNSANENWREYKQCINRISELTFELNKIATSKNLTKQQKKNASKNRKNYEKELKMLKKEAKEKRKML